VGSTFFSPDLCHSEHRLIPSGSRRPPEAHQNPVKHRRTYGALACQLWPCWQSLVKDLMSPKYFYILTLCCFGRYPQDGWDLW